jgi:LuxR family transcriptional regulator, maltose regulon positive regulatory protein
MHCHYKLNNRRQAVKWFQKCCQVLENELGVEPMQATKELHELLMEPDVTHL